MIFLGFWGLLAALFILEAMTVELLIDSYKDKKRTKK